MAANRKSPEQMNAERRLAKARQKANARAKAAHRQEGGEFSIAEVLKEQRQRAKRVATAIERGRQNGEYLIGLVRSNGSLVRQRPADWGPGQYNGPGSEFAETGRWKHYIEPEHVEEWQRAWLRDCRDVIAAAKAAPERFEWNRDWRESGTLRIGIVRRAAA